MTTPIRLFDDRTSDGSSDAVSIHEDDGIGGNRAIVAVGTFDGATVRLEKSIDGGATWFLHGEGSGADAEFTAPTDTAGWICPARYKGVLSGAGANTSITLEIR